MCFEIEPMFEATPIDRAALSNTETQIMPQEEYGRAIEKLPSTPEDDRRSSCNGRWTIFFSLACLTDQPQMADAEAV